MNQQSMHEPISLYMPVRTNHVMQSIGTTVVETNINNNNNNIINNNNNNNNNTNFFSEIQMDDGKWTRHQTQVLIDTWKEHKDVLLSTASSSAEHFRVWKLIATEVNKFSPPKSLQQCKKKFRNIRYICKMAMNNNKQEGGKKHYPMFYADFLEIISESERIKEGIKSESPNVEILNESSKDDVSYDYNHSSPPDDRQMDMRASSMEMSIRRDEDGEEKRGSNGLVMSDGSYNDSPQSRENEEFSVSPTLQNEQDRTDPDRDRVESLHNGVAENDSSMMRQKSEERMSSYYSHEPLYPSTYSSSSDNVLRKHRHNDVSIMGRGYPTAKRQKRTSETYIYSTSAPPYKYGARNNRSYPPTMAAISENSYPYTLNNHYTSNPTTVSQHDLPRKESGSPEHPSSTNSTLLLTSHSVNSMPTYNKETPTSTDNSHSRNSLPPPLKNTLFSAGIPKDKGANDLYTQRFLDIQERQMELFSEMLCRHEQFLLRLLQQQREAAEEAQKRDREFMLKLIEMFVKH